MPGCPLEQQQYLTDLRVDRYLYDTLAEEFELLEDWLGKNPGHPEAGPVASFMRRRNPTRCSDPGSISRKNSISGRRKTNEEDLAASILGWRLLCRELAESLLAWSVQKPHDPRGRQIRLWQDSPGFYPQNRLRIWAVRFLEDARAPQILAWETAVNREIDQTHPELLNRSPIEAYGKPFRSTADQCQRDSGGRPRFQIGRKTILRPSPRRQKTKGGCWRACAPARILRSATASIWP